MFTVSGNSANHSCVLTENRIRELESKRDHLLSKRSLLDTNKRGLSLERANLSKVAAQQAEKLNELFQVVQKIIRECTPKPISCQRLLLKPAPKEKVQESHQRTINKVFSADELVFCILKSTREVSLHRYARVSTCFSRVCRSREVSLWVMALAQSQQYQRFVSISDDVFLCNQAKAVVQMDYLESVLPRLIQMRDSNRRSRAIYEVLKIAIGALPIVLVAWQGMGKLSLEHVLEHSRELL